jgi:hypothetical protein
LAWALLGLVLLGGSAAASIAVPGLVADEKAFLDAQPCDSGEAAGGTAGTADCMRTIQGTVLSAEEAKSGKAKVFRVRLRPPVPDPADQPIDLDRHGELSELIKPGDEVEVTTWRYVQVAVGHDGVSETLPGLPDEDPTMFVGLSLAGVWLAVLAFIAAFGTARRARRAALRASGPVRPVQVRGRGGGTARRGVLRRQCLGRLDGRGDDSGHLGADGGPATILALRWDRDEPSTSPAAVRLDA